MLMSSGPENVPTDVDVSVSLHLHDSSSLGEQHEQYARPLQLGWASAFLLPVAWFAGVATSSRRSLQFFLPRGPSGLCARITLCAVVVRPLNAGAGTDIG